MYNLKVVSQAAEQARQRPAECGSRWWMYNLKVVSRAAERTTALVSGARFVFAALHNLKVVQSSGAEGPLGGNEPIARAGQSPPR